MDLVTMRVKVEHNRLLSKSILSMDPSSNIIEVLIDRLLQENRVRVNPIDMILDVLECPYSFLDLPIRPDCLNTSSSSLFDDLING